jgi:hypothetical protein
VDQRAGLAETAACLLCVLLAIAMFALEKSSALSAVMRPPHEPSPSDWPAPLPWALGLSRAVVANRARRTVDRSTLAVEVGAFPAAPRVAAEDISAALWPPMGLQSARISARRHSPTRAAKTPRQPPMRATTPPTPAGQMAARPPLFRCTPRRRSERGGHVIGWSIGACLGGGFSAKPLPQQTRASAARQSDAAGAERYSSWHALVWRRLSRGITPAAL